jgi:hypothetical protein
MSSPMKVIATITRQDAGQEALIEHNYMIETFAAYRADEPFHICTLPGRARCGKHLFDAHCFHLLNKFIGKDPISVAQQITRRTVPGKRIAQLLYSPLRCGMSGDAKLENAPTVVCQHQEDVEHLKPERRHGEKVHWETILFTWLSRDVRQLCEGGLLPRSMYLATVGSVISIPSLSNSPWIRGAPHSGLLRLIIRIKSRICCGTTGRPRLPRRIFQVQKRRSPFRCQAMTVAGLTINRADFSPPKHGASTPRRLGQLASVLATSVPIGATHRVDASARGSRAAVPPRS